ncbi:MAG: peptidoglycan-binding domain-containing protein [Candidatus Omnitrophota bacterium]|jgi:peptidoglycan hydrolase-like protein with peptidoglycan-binding domain|nr:peptidoglycan-binding domain-containing protein [Candidatus Omnitrophota bacterium]MDD5138276.1 peptidoglycan-binding domain-containing protein [Candidatus Omnitrophota bacterium]MDD5538899.1 peptidoglycan-binding domain-containing protein [Candidatus Omnitrophota bacterium]
MFSLRFVCAAFVISCFVVSGCSKDNKKQKFAVEEGVLNLSEADTLLSGSRDESVELVDNRPQAQTQVAVDVPVPEEAKAPAAVVLGETPDEKGIQTALKGLGLYQGEIDGKIGPKTKAAIKEFQQKNGLVADGKVGPKTWAALKAALGDSQNPQ